MQEERMTMILFIASIAIALLLYSYFGKHLSQQKQKTEETKKEKHVNASFRHIFKGKDIVVEFDKYKAVVNTQGGILKSFKLKKYKTDNNTPMEIIPPVGFFYNYYPDNETLTNKLNSAIFDYALQDDGDKKKIILKTKIDGISVEKIYTFSKDYRIDIDFKTPKIGIVFGPETAPTDRKISYSFSGPLVYDGKKAHEIKLKKEREKVFVSPYWVALQSLYFTVTVIPKSPTKVYISKINDDKYQIIVTPQERLLLSWAFAGPKKYDLLKSYGIGLEENIRFGVFGFISKPLLVFMNFIYKYIPNYGVAIIIITLIIKLIFHPLTVKGYKSMNKMKELQPLIKQIRETYKDDPNKMNQEIMELYKKYKVNPFGGCLPMLLQIPVFFALYKLLMVSIELRHAPFILWITDLSSKDPYYITPVLMGATMFIQQLLTPGQDPTQNKFMLILPVVFTIIFLNFPSGLVLYFLVSNVLSILEQIMIKTVYK